MVSGETVLKFTDYPFSYALVAVLFNSANYNITENQILFLGLAGAVGTFLTIIDPVGIGVRKRAKGIVSEINMKDTSEFHTLRHESRLSSLKTRAINFEFEKIIGLFYFLIMIFAFMFAVVLTDFVNDIMIKDSEGTSVLSVYDLRLIVFAASIFAFGALAFRAYYYWTDLREKIEIAGFHQIAINDDNTTQTSVENMSRAVEQNDWGLAKVWQKKIKEEIKYKKGKRDLIIKAADTIYSPLHFEGSEFQKYLQNIKQDPFKEFKTEQWVKIKQNSLQSIVEDTNLRRRIEDFYNLMNEYNNIVPSLFLELNKIINKSFSEKFGKNVDGVEFYLESLNSGNTAHLQICALFEINPMEFVSPPRKFGGFKLRIRSPANQITESQYTDQNSFDTVWVLVLKNVQNNDLITKLKNLLKELEVENNKLMKIYSEKIEMQWKV